MNPTPTLEVYLLGEAPFGEVQALQRRLAYDLGDGGGGALILCEHPPIITVGRNGSRAHIMPDDGWLRGHQVPTQWVNRGGGCILHLPGQLAGYAILPLDRMGLDVRGHLDRLSAAIIATLAEFQLEGRTIQGAAGVFLQRSRVASLGIAVNRWISSYGFTLNVGPYLGPFRLIAEPGPGGSMLYQTSMEARRQRPASMAKVREAMIRRFEAAYDFQGHHLYTTHPMIRGKARRHVFAQSLG
ncbi:MAG: lipoyl(octanoyl) transferase LipB [Isosphaeraceae bacterium]